MSNFIDKCKPSSLPPSSDFTVFVRCAQTLFSHFLNLIHLLGLMLLLCMFEIVREVRNGRCTAVVLQPALHSPDSHGKSQWFISSLSLSLSHTHSLATVWQTTGPLVSSNAAVQSGRSLKIWDCMMSFSEGSRTAWNTSSNQWDSLSEI